MTSPAATIVVVTHRGAPYLGDCLDAALAQQSSRDFDVLVVDNASTDGTDAALAARPAVRVVHSDRNLGFAGGVNLGLAHVDAPVTVLLNDDAVPSLDWLDRLLDVLDADERVAGVTGKVLLDQPGPPVINSAGSLVDAAGYGADRGYLEPDTGQYETAEDVFCISGCAAAFRTDAVRAAGGMDDDFFMYYEDVDLCWRLRKDGWRFRYEPSAVVRHRHAASSGQGEFFKFHDQRNRLLTLRKNAPLRQWASALLRYKLTTLSALVRRRDLADFKLRVRVLLSYFRLLPRMVRRRSSRRA